jgi:hypothetical protein
VTGPALKQPLLSLNANQDGGVLVRGGRNKDPFVVGMERRKLGGSGFNDAKSLVREGLERRGGDCLFGSPWCS